MTRIQVLAQSLRARRPSVQPVWRPALRFSVSCEKCELASSLPPGGHADATGSSLPGWIQRFMATYWLQLGRFQLRYAQLRGFPPLRQEKIARTGHGALGTAVLESL